MSNERAIFLGRTATALARSMQRELCSPFLHLNVYSST